MLQGSKDGLNCVIYSVLRRKAGLIKKEKENCWRNGGRRRERKKRSERKDCVM